MRLPRVRFTVLRMMVAVSLLGIALAGVRHGYIASVIFVYGVAGLALIRAFGKADRYLKVHGCHQLPRNFVRRAFFASLPVVTLLILGSSLPLVFIYPMFTQPHRSHGIFMRYDAVPGLVLVGSLACLPVASFLRRLLW